MRGNGPKSVPDEPSSSPLALRTPCVFCGKRLLPKEKKSHDCWTSKNGGSTDGIRATRPKPV